MYKLNNILFTVIIISLAICCNNIEPNTKGKFDHEQIKLAIQGQIDAFHHADTTMNAEAVIGLLWPEYTMLVDGKYTNYEELKTAIYTYMSSLQSFHAEWDQIRIIPLDENHAISSYIFKDSIVSKSGNITQSFGPNTFVWEKRNDQWKVLYGDADHYPLN